MRIRWLAVVVVLAACEATTTSLPTPAPSVTPLATASPSAPSRPEERFGIALSGIGMVNLRTEDDPDPLVRLLGTVGGSLSPDGRHLVWWSRTNTGAPMLMIFDTLAAAPPRAVVVLATPGEGATQLAWSADSRRVALIVRDVASLRRGAESWSAVRVMDLSGAVREVIRYERRAIIEASWYRPDRLLVGMADAAGRTSWQLVREDGAVLDASNDQRSFMEQVDDMGRYLLYADCRWDAGCDLRITSTARPDDVVSPARATVERAWFRPGSSDVVVLARDGTTKHLEVWQDGARGGRRVFGALSLIAPDRVYFRPDGSALALLEFDGRAGGRWYGDLVNLTDGAMRHIEIPRDGNPLGWIRLRPGSPAVYDTAAAPPAQSPFIGEERARWLATRVAQAAPRDIVVRLTAYIDARLWVAGSTRIGPPTGIEDGRPVYLVAVHAPMPLRGGPHGPIECEWYFAMFEAASGADLGKGCRTQPFPVTFPPELRAP